MDPLALLLKKNPPKPSKPAPKKPRKAPPKGYKGTQYEPGSYGAKSAKAATAKVRAEVKKAGARVWNQIGGQIHIAAKDKQAAALRKKGYGVYPVDTRNQDLTSTRWVEKQGPDFKLWALVAWELPEEVQSMSKPKITEAIGVDINQFRELTGMRPAPHGGLKVMGEQHHRAAVKAGALVAEALTGKKYVLDQLRRADMASRSDKFDIALDELYGIQSVEPELAAPCMVHVNKAIQALMDLTDPKWGKSHFKDKLIDTAVKEIKKATAKAKSLRESQLAEDKRAHQIMMKLKEGDKVRIESPGLARPRVVTVVHGPQKQGKVIYVGLTSGKPWGRNPKGGALLYRKDAMYGTEPDEVAFQATLSQRPVVVSKLTPMSGEQAPADGRGKGQGVSGGGRGNKNKGPCASGGPGGGKGGGRGRGANREAVGAGFDEAGADKRRKELERLVWKHTHRDFKGKYQGQKTVLTLGPKGTTMVAISDLSDDELLKKIPSRFRPQD